MLEDRVQPFDQLAEVRRVDFDDARTLPSMASSGTASSVLVRRRSNAAGNLLNAPAVGHHLDLSADRVGDAAAAGRDLQLMWAGLQDLERQGQRTDLAEVSVPVSRACRQTADAC